jgi:hypothetical protein
MAFKFFHIGLANQEIESASAVINPALVKANITSLIVDGRSVPAAEASLAARISAALSSNSTSQQSQNESELLATNAELARQIEVLTAENRALKVKCDAALNEFSNASKLLADWDRELSNRCVAVNCLNLKDNDGKPLAADATPEQKKMAAAWIPFTEKLTAYAGVVNAELARTGLNVSSLPSAGAGNSDATAVLTRLDAIKEPHARAEFFKKHQAEIFAANRLKR